MARSTTPPRSIIVCSQGPPSRPRAVDADITNERPRVAYVARNPWMEVFIPPEDLHDRPAV
ncbi:MAG: hypothetical protein KGR22_07525, partial [Planctomycetes bacterium]|nr:hypothetical protein [Planctomycetota bacterium]